LQDDISDDPGSRAELGSPANPARTDPISREMRRRNDEALRDAIDSVAPVAPSVARVLAALPLRRMSATEALCWWTAPNGWLDGRRPLDVLAHDPNAVEQAAHRLSDSTPL